MSMTLFWIAARFVFAGLPLFLALLATRRAFASSGPNAVLYMLFAGFAAVTGMAVMPWALHLEPPSLPALTMALGVSAGWVALNAALHRPLIGYRPRHARGPVFRHRPRPSRTAPPPTVAIAPPTALVSAPPRPADWPELTFLPRAEAARLQ